MVCLDVVFGAFDVHDVHKPHQPHLGGTLVGLAVVAVKNGAVGFSEDCLNASYKTAAINPTAKRRYNT